MNIKQNFLDTCLTANTIEELRATLSSPDLPALYEKENKLLEGGLSFEDWIDAIHVALSRLTTAETIASMIPAHTQGEVQAMINIVSKLNNIDAAWLFRAVSNYHMQSEKFKFANVDLSGGSENG